MDVIDRVNEPENCEDLHSKLDAAGEDRDLVLAYGLMEVRRKNMRLSAWKNAV